MSLSRSVNSRILSRKIKGYLFFCLVALWSGSALQVTLLTNVSHMVFWTVGLLCALPVVYGLMQYPSKPKKSFFAFFVLWLLLNSIIYPGDMLSNLTRICMITVGYYITEEFPASVIIKAFIRFSIVVAIAAILGTYLLKNTDLLNGLLTAKNLNGIEYKIGFIYNYIPAASDRISGFFWEPGLLATCMVFAVTIYSACCIKKIGLKEIAVLGLLLWCCFSAKSSAGYVLGILSVLTVFFRNDKTDNLAGIKKILQFILFSIAVIAFLNLDLIIVSMGLSEEYLFSKLTFSGMAESSRVSAFENNFRIWLQNPFMGVGLSEAIRRGSSIVADTSTSTFLMAAYGIGGVSYSIAIIYGVFRQKQIGLYMKMVITVIFIAIVNKEPHAGFLFTWILIFLLLDKEQTPG